MDITSIIGPIISIENIAHDKYHAHNGISNSSMSLVLPESGGSIEKYRFCRHNIPPEYTNDSIELGNLVHEYLRDPSTFATHTLTVSPSETVARIIDLLIEEDCTSWPVLTARPSENILKHARSVGYGVKWGDETVVKKVIESGEEMYKMKFKFPSLHLVDLEMGQQLDYLKPSLVKLLDDLDEMVPPSPDGKVGREDGFIFRNNFGNEFKILVDRIHVNKLAKTFQVIDYKTTYVSAAEYFGYSTRTLTKDAVDTCPENVLGTMIKRQTHRQVCYYTELLKNVAELSGYSALLPMVVHIDTRAPYLTTKRMLSQVEYKLGGEMVQKGLKTILDYENAEGI